MNCNTGEITTEMAKVLGWVEQGDPVIISSAIPTLTPEQGFEDAVSEKAAREQLAQDLRSGRERNNARLRQLAGRR